LHELHRLHHFCLGNLLAVGARTHFSLLTSDFSLLTSDFSRDFPVVGLRILLLGASLTLVSVIPTSGEDSAPDGPRLSTIEKVDLRVRQFAHAQQGDAADGFFRVTRLLGDWRVYLAATGAMYLDDDRKGELALRGGIINGIATESLRHVVGRVRPRDAAGPDAYRLEKGNSFPSGHASAAFALATALDENYGVGYVAYPVAATTAVSRIYHDGHWFSDTLMGAGIGIASVKAVALHDEDGIEPRDGGEAFAVAFGAYTVADMLAFQVEKGPLRTGIRLAAIGVSVSRIEDEEDIYGVFAGIATSVLLTRGIKKLRRLHFTPSSVSLVWEW
jgi:membrane-associated phospholipid phosphatase